MKKHTFKEWFIAVRPWSLPASVMPIVTTLAFLFFSESDVNWLHGLWALIGMILFHLTGNVWSDYFDFKKKVDSDDTFGAKTLTTGMFKPEEIKGLAIGLFVLSPNNTPSSISFCLTSFSSVRFFCFSIIFSAICLLSSSV